MIVPPIRRASSANHFTKEAPYETSARASARGLPCSSVMIRARSSWCSSISPCHASSSAARSAWVLPRHDARAAEAASIADRVSAPLTSGTVPITSCVAGSVTSTRAPEAAPRHTPAIRHCCRNRSSSLNPFISLSFNAIIARLSVS
jgi:hypothetical protein